MIRRSVILIAVAWVAAVLGFVMFANLLTQLAVMCMLVAVVAATVMSLVGVFSGWRLRGLKSVIPLLLLVVVVPLPVFLAPSLREWKFNTNFPRYQHVVAGLQSGAIKLQDEPYHDETALDAGDAKYVLAKRTNHGLVVEFITGTGFPVKHSGYLYVESGELQAGSFFDERWPRRHLVEPKWYRISD